MHQGGGLITGMIHACCLRYTLEGIDSVSSSSSLSSYTWLIQVRNASTTIALNASYPTIPLSVTSQRLLSTSLPMLSYPSSPHFTTRSSPS